MMNCFRSKVSLSGVLLYCDLREKNAVEAVWSFYLQCLQWPLEEESLCCSPVWCTVLIVLPPTTLRLQATSQSDLENWVTALHSASAALLARRHAATDTLRLLRRRCRSLLQQIDADSRMRKMAELQLSVIREPRSRRAVQSQVGGWGAPCWAAL